VAPRVEDVILDQGLNFLRANASQFFISTLEPTTFAQAQSFAIASANYGAGNIFVSPPAALGGPVGRKVTSINIVGFNTATATANWWAVCSATQLLIHGTINVPTPIISGEAFNFVPLVVSIPSGFI
jgi:hypothetical protein